MDAKRIEEIKNLILNNENVNFADYGQGTTDEWILKAEERLSFKFPESYKWWLKNYKCGEVYDEEIYSIYETDFDTVSGGDIVYMNELDRKNKLINDKQLTICRSDMGKFYFQVENFDSEEYPVYLNGEFYAKDFLEFLKLFIITDTI